MQKNKKIWLIIGTLFIMGNALLYLLFYNNSFRVWILDLSRSVVDLNTSYQKSSSYIPEEKVAVYGDSRDGLETHSRLIDLMLDKKPKAVFNTGDVVNDGKKLAQWVDFNRVTSKLRKSVEFYPILGNHEKDSSLYYANFELPGNEQWYSVDYDDIHFIVLDSNKNLDKGSEQYKWLKKDLEKSQKENDFVVVAFHHPPYSTGKHTGDEMGLGKSIVPLFEKYGVKAVFNGHDHSYERSKVKGIYYIVTGGGGATLYEQAKTSKYSQKFLKIYHYCLLDKTKNGLRVSVYNLEDKIVDEFWIR